MRFFPCGCFLLAAVPMAAAAASSGTVNGRLMDEQGKPVAGAQLVLTNRVSGYRQSVLSDARGRFSLLNVPFSQYHLEAKASGLNAAHRDLEVRSSVPMEFELRLQRMSAEVVVEEKIQLVEDHVASHLDIDKSTIDKIPAAVQSRAMESILLATPGFVADENGRFHFKGSHGQTTYVIDGIPVTDQMQATFSNSLDPSQVESLEVITGGISAEYGGKPAAVINLTSKSGLGTPNGFEGEFFFGASRFATLETGFGARGGSHRFGYFVTGGASRSDRFLDPVNFENRHNTGRTGRLFSRFDWVLGEADTLRLSVSGGRSGRDVVNLASQDARGQNQTAATLDTNLSLAWTHLFGATRSLDAALFYRHANARLDPTADLAEGFGSGGPDFPVWAKQNRDLDNLGAQIAFTQRTGETTFKAGLSHITYPVRERFRFGITDASQHGDPADPLYAYSPAGGGHFFDFEGKLTPTFSSAYVQGEWHHEGWFFSTGFRYDRYTAGSTSDAELQPRLGVSHHFERTGTVLRATYDRLMITPENENLALALSQQAWDLGPNAGTPVPGLHPEFQDSTSYGIEQQLGQAGRLVLEYWEKKATNAADNEQFFNTGVLFPIAAAKGLYRGANLRLDLVPVKGWSGYLSAGKTRAFFQAPLVGGLQLELPDRADGERFLIDHDQKVALQMGLRYEHEGTYFQLMGRYDSGLVAGDPAEAMGDADLEFGTRYVRLDSEGTWRVKPRTIWDLSAGTDWKLAQGRVLVLSADLLNATDAKGLYNFLSAFGGTHVTPPRTLALRVKLKF